MNICRSIICAVDMQGSVKGIHDKVNYYVLDEYLKGDRKEDKGIEIMNEEWLDEEETTWPEKEELLGEEIAKLESHMLLPISCISKCHSESSYIVFKSRLYRIGGSYYSEEEYKDGQAARVAILLGARVDRVIANFNPEHMYDFTRSVDILDLKNIEQGWKKGPEMNFRRSSPYPLILGGKLYVAGGIVERGYAQGDGFVDVRLMEVLDEEEDKWEAIHNPLLPHPLLIFDDDKPMCSWVPTPEHQLEDDKSLPVGQVYRNVLAGTVESSGFIIVGLSLRLDDPFRFLFYIYKPKEEDPNWMIYTEITFDYDIHKGLCLPLTLPAVVTSAKLMIFLNPSTGAELYVLDLEKGKLLSLDLCELKYQDLDPDPDCNSTKVSTSSTSVLPPVWKLTTTPRLLMLNEAEMEFCVFWTGFSVVSSVHDPPHGYSTLYATIFTLETHPVSNTLHVKLKSDSVSLIPNILNNNRLQAICIADVPLTPPSSAGKMMETEEEERERICNQPLSELFNSYFYL